MLESNMFFLKGARVWLRPVLESDLGERYLAWLNDPDVSRFTVRQFFPSSDRDMKEFFRDSGSSRILAAICVREGKQHIGNILLSDIHTMHRSAEISILIGEKSEWSHGYGAESVYLMSRHALRTLGLHRVFAGSYNPAFIRMAVEKLGWTVEGKFREAFRDADGYHDHVRLSLLEQEFRTLPEYEEPA